MATTIRMCSRTLRSIYSLNHGPGSLHRAQSLFPQRLLSNAAPENDSNDASKDASKESEAAPNTEELTLKIEALQVEKENAAKKFDDIQDKYKRSLAETENVRRRMQKQIDDAKLFGIQGFCKDLLEVADILGKATETVPKDEVSNSNPHLKNLFEGLTMTETQLQKVFTRNGLELINPSEGEKFDPNLHEALFEQPVPGKEPGTVAVVTKVGYKLHSRTLRPALVGVFKAS